MNKSLCKPFVDLPRPLGLDLWKKPLHPPEWRSATTRRLPPSVFPGRTVKVLVARKTTCPARWPASIDPRWRGRTLPGYGNCRVTLGNDQIKECTAVLTNVREKVIWARSQPKPERSTVALDIIKRMARAQDVPRADEKRSMRTLVRDCLLRLCGRIILAGPTCRSLTLASGWRMNVFTAKHC